MIINGIRSSKLGSLQVPNSKCDYCEQIGTQSISVFGKYFHVFWIPLFPWTRVAVSECSHCKKTIKKNDFTPELQDIYDRDKSELKRPLWHWSGLGIILFPFFLSLFVAIFSGPDHRIDKMNEAMDSMTSSPSEEQYPLAYNLKSELDTILFNDFKPQNFSYYSNQTDSSALILIQIPDLKNVNREGRLEVLNIIRDKIENIPNTDGKKLYIGIKGKRNLNIISTPKEEANRSYITPSRLYDYYGVKN